MSFFGRAKASAILTTIVVILLAIVDMFSALELTDVLLSPFFILPVFLIGLIAAPALARLLDDNSFKVK